MKLVEGAIAQGVCFIFAIIYKRQHFIRDKPTRRPTRSNSNNKLKYLCYLTAVNSNKFDDTVDSWKL